MTKPDWLHHQLAFLHQREETITRHITRTDQLIQDQGPQTPAYIHAERTRAHADLREVQQQLAVLNAGWDAISTAP